MNHIESLKNPKRILENPYSILRECFENPKGILRNPRRIPRESAGSSFEVPSSSESCRVIPLQISNLGAFRFPTQTQHRAKSRPKS